VRSVPCRWIVWTRSVGATMQFGDHSESAPFIHLPNAARTRTARLGRPPPPPPPPVCRCTRPATSTSRLLPSCHSSNLVPRRMASSRPHSAWGSRVSRRSPRTPSSVSRGMDGCAPNTHMQHTPAGPLPIPSPPRRSAWRLPAALPPLRLVCFLTPPCRLAALVCFLTRSGATVTDLDGKPIWHPTATRPPTHSHACMIKVAHISGETAVRQPGG
jgi:hypothetical protein